LIISAAKIITKDKNSIKFTKLMTVIFKKDGGQRHLLQWSSKSLETAPTFVSHN
jgi:hypothetical protein